MKKFSLGLVAAAALVVCGGSFASTEFRPSLAAAETRMASELNYSATLLNSIAPSSGRLTVATDLGFGVNNGQQRHIKVTLSSNATFASATAGANVVFAASCSGTTAAWVGGGLGTSYVIYQITGGTNGCTATDDVTINLPNVNVSSNTTVTSQYSLFDGAGDAVAGTSALYSTAAANFLTFTNGLVAPALSAATNQIAIAGTPNFSEFGATAVTTTGPNLVGSLTLAAASGVSARSGAVLLSDLSTADSTIKFSAANFGSGSSIGIAAATATACTGVSALTLNTALTEATFTVGNTAGTYNLCWTLSGATEINPQTVRADYNPIQLTGATITDPSEGTIGTITREGTTLMAPYVSVNPNFVSNFTFTNSGASAVIWRATVTPESGGTCAAGTTVGTIPANGIAVVRATTICPSISGAANNNRAQFSFSIEADSSSIQGTVTASDKNATSSPSTYLMVKNGAY
jgi:hypothetical protein